MKLGILTFHRAANYGAILQSYALNKYLLDRNMDTEVIDYRDNKVDNEYKIFYKSSSLKRKIRGLVYLPITYKKNKKFEKFRNSYIRISKEKYNPQNITNSNSKYDFFIVGSDQVFNYKLTNFDKNYFLNFVNDTNKKLSYAASLGMDKIPENKEKEYSELLSNFKKISIREIQNKKLVEEITNKEVSVNIDPTFLIDIEQWKKIAKLPKEKDYILIFTMQINKSIFKFAEQLSKDKNCKIIYIPNDYHRIVKGKYKYNVSPEEWLGYFINAKYVITNSFHGLSFSIILHKDFYIEMQKKPATANARLNDLLKKFNLESRKVENGRYINSKINWNLVDDIINKEKNKTNEYFNQIEDL